MDVELGRQHGRGLVDGLVIAFRVRLDQVHRQGILGGAQGPDMQVMGRLHAGQVLQVLAHGSRVDSPGNGIQRQVDGLFQQLPGTQEDHHGNNQADHRVDPGLVGEHQYRA